MTDKILLVDDDPNILAAYQRHFRKQFRIDTALGGPAGLKTVDSQGPYAVIVSDLRMPEMDGIEFLTKTKEQSPDSVRMMLTGNVDIRAAIDAVNQGWIFRFLTKPCLPQDFAHALQAGIDQYRLISGERELLQKTLNGSIRTLTEILSIVDPESFGRGHHLRDAIRVLAGAVGISDSWELELAAMLAQIGHVTIPPAILIKMKTGQSLSDIEQEMITRVPQVGHNLLVHIPRLKSVARIVLYQNKCFNGQGFPMDAVAGTNIPMGARLLKVLMDLVLAEVGGISKARALEGLRRREGWYDPAVLDAAFLCFAPSATQAKSVQRTVCSIAARDLQVGQILLSDVLMGNGALLIKAGNWISETLLERIKNFAKLHGIREPIRVEVIHESGAHGATPTPREVKL